MTPVQEAIEYAKAYEGNFGFLQDMRAKVEAGQMLSVNMVNAILRCKAREQRMARPVSQPEGKLDLSVIPASWRGVHVAVPGTRHEIEFLKIDHIAEDKESKWAGWVFVKRQYGDNYERYGAQRPGQKYVGKGEDLLEKVLANPVEAMQRYGQLLGRCAICRRELTDDNSRTLGIGPECVQRVYGKTHKEMLAERAANTALAAGLDERRIQGQATEEYPGLWRQTQEIQNDLFWQEAERAEENGQCPCGAVDCPDSLPQAVQS